VPAESSDLTSLAVRARLPGRARRVALMGLALALGSAPSRAATPHVDPTASPARSTSPADEARRARLYAEGLELARGGRWEEAVTRFREVVAIRSAPPALFTLGQAEERVGRLVSAKDAYARAEADAHATGAQDVEDNARRAIASLEPRLPSVTVRLANESGTGATATLDGGAVAIGLQVDVDPGDHRVVVSAPGRASFEATVRVASGERRDVDAVLGNGPSPPGSLSPTHPASAAPAPAPTHPSALGPVVVGSVGLVTAIAGLVLRQTGQSSYDSDSAGCPAAVCPSQSAVTEGDSARTQMIAGEVMLFAGVAAAAAALTWRLVTSRSEVPEASGGVVRRVVNTELAVTPLLGGTRAGVSVRF
jgi:hypothetical protein